MNETSESNEFNELISLFGKRFSTATLQSLSYYSIINYEQFKIGVKALNNAFEQLLYEDFARGQSSHMTEGVFGQYFWTQKMQFTKMQVISNLLQSVIAGHRLLKCLLSIRRNEKPAMTDWALFRVRLNRLHDDFRVFRNSLEHIEETIEQGLSAEVENSWRFSRHAIFDYEVKKGKYKFDFSKNETSHLILLEKLYSDFILMIRNRLCN